MKKKQCGTCYGYGLHALGEHTPMGPIDAGDGLPTIRCPECGASYNDIGKKEKKKKPKDDDDDDFINNIIFSDFNPGL